MSNRVIIDQTVNTVTTDQCPSIHNSVVVNNDTPSIIGVTENVTNIVTVAVPGPQGPVGPQGPIGLGGDITGSEYYVAIYKSATGLFTGSLYQSESFTAIRATASVDPTNPDILFVQGEGVDTLNLISAHSNYNNYVQLNIQNFSGGTSASSDIVATADTGNEEINYINMGINGSGYTAGNAIGGALDAYLYNTGENLYIGNTAQSKQIVFFNGGFDVNANAALFIHDQGTITINTAEYNETNPPSLAIQAPNLTTNTLIEGVGDTDQFLQLVVSNKSSGSFASADIVAYNNIDPTNQGFGFIDMGISSTNYNDPINYPGWQTGHSYLYTDAPGLKIGSTSGSSIINLFVGGINPITNSKLVLRASNEHSMTGSLSIFGSLTNGENVSASGIFSHAEGLDTIASGSYSHAEGDFTKAIGDYSHAEGDASDAIGWWSHAEGGETTAIGDSSHSEGDSTTAIGDFSHTEGYFTVARGDGSHAEGRSSVTSGSYSHAEGYQTVARGTYSHAEGEGSISSGSWTHAEGYYTTAIGRNSHAEGANTQTIGWYSHAEGAYAEARGDYSHAEGFFTVALGSGQHVQGQYNISSSDQSAFIIGNGTSTTARRNLVFASGSSFQITGSLQVSGSITGSIFGTSSWAQNAVTASSADDFLVRGTLTAQTIVAQTITSSTDFVTGSTKFGSLLSNTHQFTGSVSITGSLTLPYLSTGSVLFAGATDNIAEDNANLFWDNTNKRLGIGTNAPISKIETYQDTTYIAGAFSMYSNTASDESLFYFRRGRGTLTSPLGVSAGDVLGSIRFASQVNATLGNYNTNAKIDSTAETNGANLRFFTNSTGLSSPTSEKLRIFGNGNVLIQNGGTFTDSGDRLQVSGSSRFAGDMVISGSGLRPLVITSANSSVRLAINQTGGSTNTGISLSANDVSKWSLAHYIPTGTNTSFVFYNDQTGTNSLFINGDNNNVGIGKITPNARLDVSGSGIITGSLTVTQGITGSLFGTSSWALNALTASFVSTASLVGNFFVQGGNSFGTTALIGTNDNHNLAIETNGSVKMTISSSGFVGVGTTSPFTNALELLSVQGSIVAHNANSTDRYVLAGTNDLLGNWAFSGLRFDRANNVAKFGRYLNSGISEGGYIAINSIGNIGIGTVVPSASLHILGTNSAATYSLWVQNSLGETLISAQNDRTVVINNTNSADGNTNIGTRNGSIVLVRGFNNTFFGNALTFYNGGDPSTIQGFLTNPGIAIGYAQTATNPNLGTGLAIKGTTITSGSGVLFVTGSSTTRLLALASETNPNAFVVSGSGNVGIGTATPAYKLTVTGSGTVASFAGNGSAATAIQVGGGELGTLFIENQTNGGGDGINIYTQRGNTSFNIGYRTTSGANGAPMNIGNLSSFAAGNINFLQSGSTKITIDILGNLGIGTITPNAKLDVSGSAIVSGSLTVTQGITGSLFGTSSWAQNSISTSLAITASSADDFLVRGTLTAQTIVAQTITSSTDFVTGSTKFGSLLSNTHQFTGSVLMTGSLDANGTARVRGAVTFDSTLTVSTTVGFGSGGGSLSSNGIALASSTDLQIKQSNTSAGGHRFIINQGGTEKDVFKIFRSTNVLIQDGGTFTDNGFKTQINGSGSISGSLFVSGSTLIIGSSIMSGSLLTTNVSSGFIIEAKNNSGNSGGFRVVGNNVEVVGLNAIVGFVGSSGNLDLRGYSGGSTGNTTSPATTIANTFNYNASSVNTPVLSLSPAINQTGTAGYTLLDLAPTINTTGSGINYYIRSTNFNVLSTGDIQTSGSTRFGSTTANTHQFTGSVNINGNLTSNVSAATISSPFSSGNYPLSLYDGVYNFNFGFYASGIGGNRLSIYRNASQTYFDNSSGDFYFNSSIIAPNFYGTASLAVTSSYSRNFYVSGALNIGNTNIEFQENTNVTSGSWRVVVSEPTASYRAAFFDYVMFSGSIARAGTLYSVWSASYAEYYENYTGDVGGSTSGVTLQAAISGSNIQLQATASNNAWTIRSLVRML